MSIPEIVIFSDANFSGANYRTSVMEVKDLNHLLAFQTFVNIGTYEHPNYQSRASTWNDIVSSVIVVSGVWQFYKHKNFVEPVGPELQPGYYPKVSDVDIPNDQVSSFKCIRTTEF